MSKSILMIYAGSVDEKELKENIDNQLQELAILIKLGRQSVFFAQNFSYLLDFKFEFRHNTAIKDRDFLTDEVLDCKYGFEAFECADGYFNRLLKSSPEVNDMLESVHF